ncbi:hypothetical protein N4G70_28165 [Streptomyces sp. ASQP_92]|uniref:hypothetical protein n=1 Tax=Streptomyces sp. ASQP_92 TaxID=2979116 RepID=UPI0021C08A19|nr:hypothetical protein [Streptomyces sp. ASQP_92]MCT9092714.1 hypothetical protein [Streptomyces sp. ASQP_92]
MPDGEGEEAGVPGAAGVFAEPVEGAAGRRRPGAELGVAEGELAERWTAGAVPAAPGPLTGAAPAGPLAGPPEGTAAR